MLPLQNQTIPLPQVLAIITVVFFVPTVLPFGDCHINGIVVYVTFEIWLLSLGIIHLKFTHVVVYQ